MKCLAFLPPLFSHSAPCCSALPEHKTKPLSFCFIAVLLERFIFEILDTTLDQVIQFKFKKKTFKGGLSSGILIWNSGMYWYKLGGKENWYINKIMVVIDVINQNSTPNYP